MPGPAPRRSAFWGRVSLQSLVPPKQKCVLSSKNWAPKESNRTVTILKPLLFFFAKLSLALVIFAKLVISYLWRVFLQPRAHLSFYASLTRLARNLADALLAFNWNDRRSRRVFLCFYSAIFKLTSARFQTFAYNSRTVWSNYMKF